MGYDAFLRFYSRDDLQLVSQYVWQIINDGYSILIESSKTNSGLVESVVERAIKDSALIIFFMPVNTNISETSFWDEVNFADMKGKKIIHVLSENFESTLKAVSIKEKAETICFDLEDPSSVFKQLQSSIATYIGVHQSPVLDKNDSPEYLFTLGKYHALTKNDEESTAVFQSAAKQDYAPALFELAHLYMYGRGLNRSNNEAEKLLIRAANQGYTPAQFELACNYIVGHGFKKDYNKVQQWLQIAAELGDSPAQVLLGRLFYKGEICERNYRKAIFWFISAAIQGNKNAQYELGNCYLLGRGVRTNRTGALQWFTRAAERNHQDAQCMVGFCFEKGYGTAIDFQKAMVWYRKAAEKGHPVAIDKLRQLSNMMN